jgi:hypothetical protein
VIKGYVVEVVEGTPRFRPLDHLDTLDHLDILFDALYLAR